MTRAANIVLLLLIGVFLQSCFKEDEMITPVPRGDVETDTIAMTEYYRFQHYYSLDS